ncbi:hypothetical protein I4F81_012532 [Pyropia yezoensis]|uniref:Uncharacterized protein n=1 Tax=Pyropia yezoensis TaxID=2788 RepID=A0ACC3CIY4_PYRYE|nr:hypothetical protein I4F81_012532 [Neopyropia yezoensis]
MSWALPGVRVIRFRASRVPALIPVVLVLGIITLSWGTTVFGALLPLLSSAPLTALAGLLVFHSIVAAVVANYLLYKPDRTHHCRRCGMCVMKMDHDCVFIANCVGAGNHKFFLSFIFWAFLGTLFTTVVAGPAFFRILTSAGGHVGARRPRHMAAAAHVLYDAVAAAVSRRSAGADGGVLGGSTAPPRADLTALLLGGYILNTSFTFALGIFVVMHAYLLSRGRTTIEMYELADAQRLASARARPTGAVEPAA